MNTFFHFKSLRTRLAFWFLAVTMLSLTAVVTILYFQRAEVISDREFEKLRIVRDLKARTLTVWLNERMSDLKVLTENQGLRNLDIEGALRKKRSEWTRQDRESTDIARTQLQSYVEVYDAYHDIFVVGAASGKVEIDADRNHEGEDKSMNLYFTEPMRTGKPYIKDIYYSKTERKPSMAFSVPIFRLGHDGEHITGVVVARADLEHVLYPLLQEHTGLGETGETLIVTKDGVALNELRWHENAPLKLKITSEHAVQAAAGQTGIVETEDYRGERVLAAYTHIPLTKWGLVAKRDLAEVYAPIRAMLWDMTIILGASAVLILVVSVLLARSFARPIVRLTEAAATVAGGDLTAVVREETKDEIGRLAASFNDMVEKLRAASETAQREDWLNTGLVRLSDVMRSDLDIIELSGKVISEVTTYLDAQVGAFYVLNPERRESGLRATSSAILSLTGSYAYQKRKNLSNQFKLGEGLAGQAALEKQRILVRNVPEEYMQVTSTLVQGVPRFVCVAPFLAENHVRGVIEIGFLHEITDLQLDYLDQVLAAIAVNVWAAQGRTELDAALKESQALSEDLQTQQEELKTANEELEEQTRALQESDRRLREQQEELQVTNEELEEKTESLEGQKHDIEQTNAELEESRQDIEQKAKELALASKYKSEFLANMSHELRTPLSSLLILASLLAENKEGNLTDDQVESTRVIQSSGNDLLSLINEILDLSKIEAGQMELRIKKVAIEDLADGVRTVFKHVFDERGLELKIAIDKSAPKEITSDCKRIEQIIRNLISNAVKFTEEGGVTLSFSTPAKDTIAIAVEDTGIGIPVDKQEIIFEAFQQVDGGTARKYGGTGLGLSICRNLVRLLGGEIKLKSEEGKGSTFTVYLPTETKAPQGIVAERPEKKPVAGKVFHPPAALPSVADDRGDIAKGNRVILVVEDDPEFAKLLLGQCREKGFKCLVAATGEEGLRLAGEHALSAVILDIKLPGMDGWSVLDQLKDKTETRHVPVHIMSVEEPSLNALSRGAIGFLQKPVSPDDLRDVFGRIEDIISRKVKNLLVVEDDEKLRNTIVKLVGNDDVHTDETATGKETVEKLKLKKYDCMILDLNLPDMSGFELLEKMEELEDVIVPPIVVYTGRDLTRKEEETLRGYTDSIIVKGVRSEERLFDEVSLFLHRIVEKMPKKKRQMITDLHDVEGMFKGKKVLVVDDDMRSLFALAHALAAKGIRTMKAEDGRKALEVLEAEPDVDLVLMDIMMPVMDGYETMKRIRAQQRFDRLPIIALTAKAMKQDRHKCIAAGANDYLPKPVDTNRLFSMMRVWMYA